MASPSSAFILLLLLASYCDVIFGCHSGIDKATEKVDYSDLSYGITSFSGELLNEVSKANPGKSVILSGLSVNYVLFMTYLGAKGETASELISTIGVDEDQASDQFTTLTDTLANLEGVTFNMANKIYVKSGEEYSLNAEYENNVIDTVDSDVESIDFDENTQAANEINSWVEQQTNNKIKDLIKPDDLDSSTRLVLINAIYFKGTWQKTFNEKETRNRDFHVTNQRTVQVPTMTIKARLPYSEDDDLGCKVLKLDYVGGNASMVIFLPGDIEGIDELNDKIQKDTDAVYRAIDRLSVVEVDVHFPKFKTETNIDLKEILRKLGVELIFDTSKSELDNMLDNPQPLYVSKMIQKAVIEVNELGAEAAAATAAVISARSASVSRPRPITFYANHAFAYAIITSDEVTLFSGVYDG